MKDQALKLRLMSKNLIGKVEDRINGENRKTKIIAVTSGKGGVGKTNFTINFALSLIEYGYNTMILDADLGMANVDLVLGLTPEANLYHVLAGQKQLSEIIINGPNSLKVIPGGSGIIELADLELEQIWHFINQLEELDGEVDILLVDTGAGISRSVISFLMAADEIILLTTPEPPAIADAYGVIKALTKRDWDKEKKINLVVNRVDSDTEGQISARKLEMAASKFLNYNLSTLGYLPIDPKVSQAVKNQRPFVIEYPYSKIAIALKELTANYCQQPVKQEKSSGIVSFIKKTTSFLRG